MTRRVRLSFSSDIVGLALPRSSLILLPKLNKIGDVSCLIHNRYFSDVSDIGVRIELGNFTIDQSESAEIIRDEDTLMVVIVAAKQSEPPKQSGQLTERSLRKIENHRARREKQRETKKLSRKTKVKKGKTDFNPSGGVVITAYSSNSDAAATSESPETQQHVDKPEAVSIKTGKPVISEKPAKISISRQPQSFSRLSLDIIAAKPLPKGHFRFENRGDALDAVPAETEAPLCAARDAKSVERAKRLGSFYFKSPPLTEPAAITPVRVTSKIAAFSEFGSKDLPAVEISGLEQVTGDSESTQDKDAKMSHTGPKIEEEPLLPAKISELRDSERLEIDTNGEDYVVEHGEQAALLETIATRGMNFFAPRTLGRYGLKHDEMESDDSSFQTHCESLASISDFKWLTTGVEIAFRRLEIVNWSPQMSKFRKYRVLEIDDTGKIVTLVTIDDQEEVVSFQEMCDVKLLDEIRDAPLKARVETSVDQDLVAALQAKREVMLAKAQQ